jgi:thiamine-phosphate pyrophosphorylase
VDLRLIVITDRRTARSRTVDTVVRAALEAGAPAVQLRDKEATAADLYRQARVLRALTRQHAALLFVNDRLDVALAAGADGVHLGPSDLPLRAAREVARQAGRPDLLIGASTDDPHRAQELEHDGADYLGCGAVFATSSKPEVRAEQIGTARLDAVASAVAIPVVAIGGITVRNAAHVARTRAAGIAVIGAVMGAHDPGHAVRQLLAAVGSIGRER